jgi:hypothetical protein
MEPLALKIGILFLSILMSCATISGESLVFPPYLHSYGIRKATPAHLMMFFGIRTFFNDPQGLATTRLKVWDDPKKTGDDDEVVVYGVNSGRGEIIYNTSMYSLGLYGGKGNGVNQFMAPKGITANSDGYVFVADSGNNRVVKLFNPKSSLQWRAVFTGKTGLDRGLIGPSRIGIDENVNVYVTDPGNSRIVVFDSTGKVLRCIPATGMAAAFSNGPTALAIADGRARYSYYSDEKAVFCADRNGSHLWKIGFDGRVILQGDMPPGYSAFYGAADYFHNYWVTDMRKHCILKFDHNLSLLDIFGSFGEGDNQFNEPRGITIYKRFGQVFIAEKKGAQYFWVGTDYKRATLSKSGDKSYVLSIKTTEFSLVTLFSAVAKDTIFYFKRHWVTCGLKSLSFENKKGIREQGLTLKIEPTYSSFTYSSWSYPIKISASK